MIKYLLKRLVGYAWKKLKRRLDPEGERVVEKINELEDRVEYLEKREDKRKSRLLS